MAPAWGRIGVFDFIRSYCTKLDTEKLVSLADTIGSFAG